MTDKERAELAASIAAYANRARLGNKGRADSQPQEPAGNCDDRRRAELAASIAAYANRGRRSNPPQVKNQAQDFQASDDTAKIIAKYAEQYRERHPFSMRKRK